MKTLSLSLKDILTWLALLCAIVLFGFTMAFAKTTSENKDTSIYSRTNALVIIGILPPVFHIPNPLPNPDPIKPFIPADSSPRKRSFEIGKADELNSQTVLTLTNLKVYPNPSDGKFTLSFQPEFNTTVEIRIADITGKEVFVQRLDNFSGNYNSLIDLSDKGKGIYILSIEQNNERVAKKIVIS